MKRHKGFSLLEILVAFSIMAVALTIVLRIFGSGVNNAVISEEYNSAVMIAESLLARSGVESPLQVGEIAGSEQDKYDWRVTTTLVVENTDNSNLPENPAGPPLSLFSVRVQVFWGDNELSRRGLEIVGLKTL